MTDYPIEISVLLAASRLNPGEDFERLLDSLPEAFDWELLVNNAFSHGVNGLLCHSLLSAPQQFVPEEIRHACRKHLKHLAEKNQQQSDQLTFILGELNLASIKAIPFKGPTLAMSAYGQLNLRTFHDLDFLICKKDIQPCMDKLRKLGYTHERDLTPRQWHEFIYYTCEEILFGPGLPLEPHWAFSPGTLAQQVDYEGIWARAEDRIFNQQSVLGLSPEDELLVLCIHGCKEEWTKLKWVVDVAEFIRSHPTLAWEALIDRATKQGLARIVRIGLLISQRLVQVKIPEKVNVWMESDRRASELVMRLTDDIFSINKKDLDIWKPGFFHWFMRERLGDRLRYFFRTISQPRVQHFADIAIPDRFFFLYRPYRLIHDIVALPAWKLIKKLREFKYRNETS
jgi:hypothetical protein